MSPVSSLVRFSNWVRLRWQAAAIVSRVQGSAHCWRDRGEIQRTAKQFAATARREAVKSGFPENEAIVYVIGEPALVFGMKAAGLPAVGPVQGLGFLNSPVLRPTLIAFPSRPSAMSPADREILDFRHNGGASTEWCSWI